MVNFAYVAREGGKRVTDLVINTIQGIFGRIFYFDDAGGIIGGMRAWDSSFDIVSAGKTHRQEKRPSVGFKENALARILELERLTAALQEEREAYLDRINQLESILGEERIKNIMIEDELRHLGYFDD